MPAWSKRGRHANARHWTRSDYPKGQPEAACLQQVSFCRPISSLARSVIRSMSHNQARPQQLKMGQERYGVGGNGLLIGRRVASDDGVKDTVSWIAHCAGGENMGRDVGGNT